jgi:hypothetical protein
MMHPVPIHRLGNGNLDPLQPIDPDRIGRAPAPGQQKEQTKEKNCEAHKKSTPHLETETAEVYNRPQRKPPQRAKDFLFHSFAFAACG